MTPLSRSQYELGDPTYDHLAATERRDHLWAAACVTLLEGLADCLVSGLIAQSVLPGGRSDDARVIVFGILADALYGNLAIDTPALRGDDPARRSSESEDPPKGEGETLRNLKDLP